MDLISSAGIAKAFEWFATLGRAELRQVRHDAEELLGDMRKSLVSLWDVATEVTRLEPEELTTQTFKTVFEYFVRFYLNPTNISAGRTHCGNVERDVERITFKLSALLHSDLGRWSDAKSHLNDVIVNDIVITTSYDRSIAEIHQHLQAINQAFQVGDDATARTRYSAMCTSLKPDILQLEQYVAVMEKANRQLWSISG